jgi:chromate reductase
MITVISSTNRKGSLSSIVAQYAFSCFQKESSEVQFLDLAEIPLDFIHEQMYKTGSVDFHRIQDKYIVDADKLFFVIPEYNGSFPGILKAFIDACSVRKYKESFHGGKKAALLGISSGRAGNLRGLEHFTGVLNYLQISVMPPNQPLGSIDKIVENGFVVDPDTMKTIENQVKRFLDY